MKKLNTKSLQNLCNTHSVSGDTLGIISSLQKRLTKMGFQNTITPFGVLLCGNTKNPKCLVSAHVDEVGFQVVKQNPDTTFLVRKSGHIDSLMLNNTHVYVQTAKGVVSGTFYPKKDLGENNPQNFTEIFLDTTDNSNIAIGDFGSYQRVFFETKEKIIASGLDNKIGVEVLLELLEDYPELCKTTLFAFVTEEETSYDCIRGIAHMYKPEYAIVVDMFPVNHVSSEKVEVLPEMDKGPGVLFSFKDYSIHPVVKEKLQHVSLPYPKVFADIPFPPEPQATQQNGITKGINIYIPLLGWHSALSTLVVSDFEKTKLFVKEVHDVLTKKG